MNTDDATDPALAELLPATDSDLRATVFVQSLAPAACKHDQDRLVAQLEALAEDGPLDAVDLLVWGDSICTGSPLTEVGNGKRIIDSVGAFYELAADSDLSVSPFFSISTVTTEYSESSFRRIVPPCLAVALYEGTELAAVFPCLVDGTAYRPDDLLTYLTEQEATDRLLVDEPT